MLSIPFLINLIILANSRASFLAVVVIAILSLIWIKGKLRFYVFLGLIAGVGLVFMLANEQFWERQSTIQNYKDEGSAMSRFYLWNGAIEMWKDNPIGLGGEGFEELIITTVPLLRSTAKYCSLLENSIDFGVITYERQVESME